MLDNTTNGTTTPSSCALPPAASTAEGGGSAGPTAGTPSTPGRGANLLLALALCSITLVALSAHRVAVATLERDCSPALRLAVCPECVTVHEAQPQFARFGHSASHRTGGGGLVWNAELFCHLLHVCFALVGYAYLACEEYWPSMRSRRSIAHVVLCAGALLALAAFLCRWL